MIAWENVKPLLLRELREALGEKLLYVGLQGSYQRGEATEDSDLDLVVIVEELSVRELTLYRQAVDQMEWRDKACGFICGKRELERWPSYERFQLLMDTRDWFGSLAALLPQPERRDIEQSIRNQCAALYHTLCHQYLYERKGGIQDLSSLSSAYKSAFFILQAQYYLTKGIYPPSRPALLRLLEEDGLSGPWTQARRMMQTALTWNPAPDSSPDRIYEERFALLFDWCSRLLREG